MSGKFLGITQSVKILVILNIDGYMLTSSGFAFIHLRYILICIDSSKMIGNSPTSTGYFSNSTSTYVTNHRFFRGPSASKTNRLYVDVFWFSFVNKGTIYCIGFFRMTNNLCKILHLNLWERGGGAGVGLFIPRTNYTDFVVQCHVPYFEAYARLH